MKVASIAKKTALPIFPPCLQRVEGVTTTTISFHIDLDGQQWAIESDLTFPFIFTHERSYADGPTIVQRIDCPLSKIQLAWSNIRATVNGTIATSLPIHVSDALVKYGAQTRDPAFHVPASDPDPHDTASWKNSTRTIKRTDTFGTIPVDHVSEFSRTYLTTLRLSLHNVLVGLHLKHAATTSK